jgi:hypothetical protein
VGLARIWGDAEYKSPAFVTGSRETLSGTAKYNVAGNTLILPDAPYLSDTSSALISHIWM